MGVLTEGILKMNGFLQVSGTLNKQTPHESWSRDDHMYRYIDLYANLAQIRRWIQMIQMIHRSGVHDKTDVRTEEFNGGLLLVLTGG